MKIEAPVFSKEKLSTFFLNANSLAAMLLKAENEFKSFEAEKSFNLFSCGVGAEIIVGIIILPNEIPPEDKVDKIHSCSTDNEY